MDQEDFSIIEEAWRTRLRDETVERSLGRTIRRRGLEFSLYVKIMSEIRETASEKGMSPDDYLRLLLKK
jgi:DNA-binding winged helix-turn-helix (wHTH) protein